MVSRIAGRLDKVYAGIRELLFKCSVLSADETGLKANGKFQWMHSVSSGKLSYFSRHEKRGFAAMQDMDILEEHEGQAWPVKMKALLLEMKEKRGLYVEQGRGEFLRSLKEAFLEEFDALTVAGMLENPLPGRGGAGGKSGRCCTGFQNTETASAGSSLISGRRLTTLLPRETSVPER